MIDKTWERILGWSVLTKEQEKRRETEEQLEAEQSGGKAATVPANAVITLLLVATTQEPATVAGSTQLPGHSWGKWHYPETTPADNSGARDS